MTPAAVRQQEPASVHQDLAGQLLDVLPQTQCKRCGYPDCAAYAQAIAQGQAGIDQCQPGGAAGISRLHQVVTQHRTNHNHRDNRDNRDVGNPNRLVGSVVGTVDAITPSTLNPDYGEEGPCTVAFIDEDWCIGCTLCIAACPVDAIIGINKRMHTVLEMHCTGCELCLPVCPVDCILLENVTGEKTGWDAWSPDQAAQARQRYHQSGIRRAAQAAAHQTVLEAKARLKLSDLAHHSQHTDPVILDKKRAIIEAALARARARRAENQAPTSTDGT